MLQIPPISHWWKYARLWIIKFRWIEPVCHTVWERCMRTQIKARDLLEAKTYLLSQHIHPKNNSKQVFKEINIAKAYRQLTPKEAAKIIWHSFRFSNGNAALQFTMLLQAWKKYWTQEISVEEVSQELEKLLKIWKKHTKTTEYKNENWRPPHPKVHRFTTETHTDIWLSQNNSHKTITSDYISESTEVIKMLLYWDGKLTRSNRDWSYYISAKREYLNKSWIIKSIFEADFKYLLDTDYQWNFNWRPNRDPKNDGKNNLQDRFFSYLVWFWLRRNSSGNEFFDEYFNQIQESFHSWFDSLPSDRELEEINSQEKEERDWYTNKKPFRKDRYWYFTQITKEDILLLIAQYNVTHPNNQVEMSELWLSEYPDYKSALI